MRTPRQVVVSGYATLDYVVRLAEPFHGTGTVAGELGGSGAWPRAGGAALYASRRIAAAGHRAQALTWIGDDADGGHYLSACQEARVGTAAIDRRPGAVTPRCILIYGPDGDHGCLLDAGLGGSETVTPAQADLLRGADHVCLSVGPPEATRTLLSLCPPATELSWIAKLDRRAFPPELARDLAGRARLIFCNAGEREFVEAARAAPRAPGQIIIETLGSAGVLIDEGTARRVLPADALQAADTTGAGDTLAGEVIARLVGGGVSLDDAVRLGMVAARELLAGRLS